MLLYRPLGLRELQLVAQSGFRAWPARLPHQPTFYPVLTFEYASSIARDWNTKDEASGFVGFVARFTLDDDFAARYPVKRVGGRADNELWVPADELPAFNQHLRGSIEIVAAFAGPRFEGTLDPVTHLPVEPLLARPLRVAEA